MPIPPFTIDGILPPYVGAHGPGGAPQDMTPYAVTALEIAVTLGHTDARREILRGWLHHRERLRAIGYDRGFQWVDGSFVEQKDPNDIDVVSFFYRPADILDAAQEQALIMTNIDLFDRAAAKKQFHMDALFVGLHTSPEVVVALTSYYLGLFSHRRGDDLWKGMLKVQLDPIDDAAALASLEAGAAIGAAPALGGQS